MSAKLTISDRFPLPNSSVKIPRLGFGVYQSSGQSCVSACVTALKAGYRHIDSAQYYANEAEVRESIIQSGIPRKDVFLTTKILSAKGSVDKTYQSVLESVHKMDGENGYVDLFLIHTASGGAKARKEMWLALERLHEEGKAKSIGVSNWGIGNIEELKGFAKIWPPAVNQIELHPWCQQKELDAFCQKQGIVVEAYCPLVRNQKAKDPTLSGIAKAHSKTTAQILVRYGLQKNWVSLPKSENATRIAENADAYDFELSKEDMARLNDLSQEAEGAIVQFVDNS